VVKSDLDSHWLAKGALRVVFSVEPDSESFPGNLYFNPPTSNDDIVQDHMPEIEWERIYNDQKFFWTDSAYILDDEIIDPGMLIVVDPAVHAWLTSERIVVLEAIWTSGISIEKHHTDVLRDELSRAFPQCAVR